MLEKILKLFSTYSYVKHWAPLVVSVLKKIFIYVICQPFFGPTLASGLHLKKKLPSKISEDTFTQVSVLMTKWFRRKGIFIDVSLFIPIVKCQHDLSKLGATLHVQDFWEDFYLNLHKNSSPIESHPTPWDNDFTKL